MDGWGEVSRIPATARSAPGPPGAEPPQISALAFDNTTNLVWCGDTSGYTASFTPQARDTAAYAGGGTALYRYTKFRASPRRTPVVQLLNHQKGILSLSADSVAFHRRRGVCTAVVAAPLIADPAHAFRNLTCMALAYASSSELILGGYDSLLKVDLNKPTAAHAFAHAGDVAFVNYSSKLLTLGRTYGALEIFDPVANQSVKSFAGHSGLLSALDVKGNYVATCGYSARSKRYGAAAAAPDYMVDPLVNVYDLRMMRPLSPVPFSAGASFVRFHPKLPNILVVASATGQIQFVDLYNQSEVHLYQADVSGGAMDAASPAASYLANLDVSENGEFLCFSDGHRNMHLWSVNSATSTNFTNFPAALARPDAADPAAAAAPPVSLDDKVPLNAVGMPYYKEYLLSNFPAEAVYIKESARVPAKPELALVSPAATAVPYDPHTHGPRYAVEPYASLKTGTHTKPGKPGRPAMIPRFLSERSAAVAGAVAQSPAATLSSASSRGDAESPSLAYSAAFAEPEHEHEPRAGADSEPVFQLRAAAGAAVPACYAQLEIHYSRFGVDDFDFSYYNRSGFVAGLENHMDNSYTNSLLQVYRHIPVFYNTVTHSLLREYLPNDTDTVCAQGNAQGSSVLNELAYLFDMMHHAGARNVSSSNFSLLLGESRVAQAHGLVNKDDGKSLTAAEQQSLVVTFHKFLVESVANDFAAQFRTNMSHLTASHYELQFVAPDGAVLDTRAGSQATVDLATPPSVLGRAAPGAAPAARPHAPQLAKRNHNVLTYLDHSLNQSKRLAPSAATPHEVCVRQTLTALGPVLPVNLPFSDAELAAVKHCKHWLVPEFYAVAGAAKKLAFRAVVAHAAHAAHKYELRGYVCQVSHGPPAARGKHNLVSYAKVRAPSGRDQWFLFNDFLVMPVPDAEVFDLAPAWKRPVVLVYADVDAPRNRAFDYFDAASFRRLAALDASVLYKDHFACGIRRGHRAEYELLTRSEAPAAGALVALDAEFVSSRPEVAEVRYTGSRNLVRPKTLSLARISALRGDAGPRHGVPFIDDYIVHTRPIYDYLTTFSGIEDGDLDPARSKKTLVTLQTAYRRLWLLLNLGCVFVGHGLKSDFRCINLQVPRSQIRDTIEFYYLPDFRRRLSLKFLAHVVLREQVQTNNHDSIEDARTALLLYEKYMEWKRAGDFENALRRIYSEGQQIRFRVPE